MAGDRTWDVTDAYGPDAMDKLVREVSGDDLDEVVAENRAGDLSGALADAQALAEERLALLAEVNAAFDDLAFLLTRRDEHGKAADLRERVRKAVEG